MVGIIAFAIILMAAVWNIGTVLSVVKTALGTVSFFIIGLCVAYLMNAPMRLVETRFLPLFDRWGGQKWVKIRRPASVFLTVVLILLILLFVVFQIIPELGTTFTVLGEQIPVFFENVNEWIAGFAEQSGRSMDQLNMPRFDWAKIGDAALSLIQDGVGNFVQRTMLVASSFVSSVINAVVGIVIGIYILLQKERLIDQLKRLLYAYLPEYHVSRAIEIASVANLIFYNFITGQFLEAIILGALCLLGMHFLGFPFAPAVAALISVTAFVPIIGGFIGLVIGAFMILVNQGVGRALGFGLFFFALQQVEGNFIYPHVVGKRVMLPGLWVLTAVTLGGNIAGILGMLLSVPLSSLLYTLLRDAMRKRTLARQQKNGS